jgi:signal transduction histidine kinase
MNKGLADSLVNILPSVKDSTLLVKHLNKLSGMFMRTDMSLALKYATRAIVISRKINFKDGLITALGNSGFINAVKSDWPQSVRELKEAMSYLDENDERMILLWSLMFPVYNTKGDYAEALSWSKKSLNHPLFPTLTQEQQWPALVQTGMAYFGLKQLDSASKYAELCLPLAESHTFDGAALTELSYSLLGDIALESRNFSQALLYYGKADDNGGIAQVFDLLHRADSSIYYARLALVKAQRDNSEENIQQAAAILAHHLESGNPVEANGYLKIYIDSRNRQFNSEKLKKLETIKLKEQQTTFETDRKLTAQRSQFMVMSVGGVALVVAGFALFFFRSNRLIKSTNNALNRTLSDLKSTQSQLIQSEKMASLGELTAGIAHEIQNPLNFVNNFSEVNKELLEELNQEIEKGDLVEAKSIAKSVTDNQEKINQHGKRADAIVKSMLQHSRKSTGQKELTDINALCDEYLRLAYHGLRAKDKSFNARFETDFDPSIPKISVIPQDIGRVILNLINNAFYSITEKSKMQVATFEPLVKVITKKQGDKIEINVQDNGRGIPESIKEKIFQPFFTTKPVGQGTGLGLSLAYDIVTKGHGGDLKVGTLKDEGATFIILIPIF